MTLKRYDTGQDQFVQAEYRGQMPVFRHDSGASRWLDAYLTDGLVGYWSGEDNHISGSTALDASGQNNDGTMSGGVTTGVSSPVGNGFGFDGTDDRIDLPDNIFSAKVPLSFGGWFRPRDVTAGRNDLIRLDDTAAWDLTIGHGGANSLDVWQYGTWYDGVATVNADTDYHMMVVDDGTDFYVYLDGSQVFTTTSSSGPGTGGNSIAYGVSVDRYYADFVASAVRFYNRAISATEVSALYKQGLAL